MTARSSARVSLDVYVSAPFDEAETVRWLHGRLVAKGHARTSRWADNAQGPERLDTLDDAARERRRQANYAAIRDSDVMIVIGTVEGCETLVEVGVAIANGVPIVWVNGAARVPLSATCTSVCTRVRSVEAALEALAAMGRREAA